MIMHNPAHPGEVLQDYMGGVEVTSFAHRLGVSRTTLSRLLHGKSGVSAPMALRLAATLKTSPELWLGMQMQYDLWQAMEAEKAVKRAKRSKTPTSVGRVARSRRASGYSEAA